MILANILCLPTIKYIVYLYKINNTKNFIKNLQFKKK